MKIKVGLSKVKYLTDTFTFTGLSFSANYPRVKPPLAHHTLSITLELGIIKHSSPMLSASPDSIMHHTQLENLAGAFFLNTYEHRASAPL